MSLTRSPVRLAALVLLVASSVLTAQTTWHVDDDSSDPGDGTSWAGAFDDLQDALGVAVLGDTIRVAQGTYRPDGGTLDPDATFTVPGGVTVLGGYAGVDAADPDARLPATYPTVLDGDLLGDDGPFFQGRLDNSNHVVSLGASLFPVVFDGLTIRGGNARSTAAVPDGGGVLAVGAPLTSRNVTVTENQSTRHGGGMRVQTGALVLEDCRFLDNRVSSPGGSGDPTGGGLSCAPDSLEIVACRFFDNTLSGIGPVHARGGGAWISAATGSVRGSRFIGNTAGNASPSGIGAGGAGGGLYAVGAIQVADCVFIDNGTNSSPGTAFISDATGAGAFLSDGVQVMNSRFHGNRCFTNGLELGHGAYAVGSGLCFTDCVFTGNGPTSGNSALAASSMGGGLVLGPIGDLLVTHCTFAANGANHTGGVLVSPVPTGGDVTLQGCVLWGNVSEGVTDLAAQIDPPPGSTGLILDHCDVQGLTPLENGNLAADPLFVDLAGPDGMIGTEDDDVSLQPGSPCIDAGASELLPADVADLDCDGDVAEAVPLDVDGLVRVVDDPATPDTGGGAAPVVDMGAHEFGSALPAQQWTDLGGALAGTFGTATLTGAGTLCPGSEAEVALSGALPGSTAALVLGLSAIDAPFKGGTLVPTPDLILAGLPTGPGGFTLILPLPLDDLSGLALYWQVWIADPGAPAGFAASNGVVGVVP